MESDIYNHLSYYSQQDKSIPGGIHQGQLKSNSIRAKLVKDLVSIGKDSITNDVGEIIGDFFKSSRAKRYGKNSLNHISTSRRCKPHKPHLR